VPPFLSPQPSQVREIDYGKPYLLNWPHQRAGSRSEEISGISVLWSRPFRNTCVLDKQQLGRFGLFKPDSRTRTEARFCRAQKINSLRGLWAFAGDGPRPTRAHRDYRQNQGSTCHDV
jgi:hypothetical protein